MDSEPKNEKIFCGCGAEIPFNIEAFTIPETMAFLKKLRPTICDDCGEKIQKQRDAEVLSDRLSNFEQICPALYINTDPEHPTFPREMLAKVLAWKYGPRGLVIRGDSRKGKSRCVWQLIKRLVMEGRKVEGMTSSEFARRSSAAWATGHEAVSEWVNTASKAEILFIDDLGKFKLTERVEADLFDIIENRVANLRPIIITTNFTGDLLEKSFSETFAVPLVSRLREFCEPIHFK